MHVSVAIAQVNKTQFKIAITQITKQRRSGEKIFSSEQVAAAKIPVHWVLVVSFIISMMIYQYGKENNNSEQKKQNLISLRRIFFPFSLSETQQGENAVLWVSHNIPECTQVKPVSIKSEIKKNTNRWQAIHLLKWNKKKLSRTINLNSNA